MVNIKSDSLVSLSPVMKIFLVLAVLQGFLLRHAYSRVPQKSTVRKLQDLLDRGGTQWNPLGEYHYVTRFKKSFNFSPDPHYEDDAAKEIEEKVAMPGWFDHYNWKDYYDYDKIIGWMEDMSVKYSDLVSIEQLGWTYQFRRLLVAKVTASKNISTPSIWIEGGVHGLDYIAPSTVTYIMNKLVTNASYHDLLSNINIYFMPVVNPDGYAFTFTSSSNRFWRKNRSPTSSLFGCKGVDLDHNWDSRWESGWACSSTNPGSDSFSEKETRAIRDKILTETPFINGYISFRSFGQNWLFPYGSYCKIVENLDVVQTAFDAVDAVESYRSTPYYATAQAMQFCGTQCSWMTSYRGGSLDWMYEIANITYSYVVNLPDHGLHGHKLPAEEIIPVGEETFLGVEVVLNRIINPVRAKTHSVHNLTNILELSCRSPLKYS